jgi:hypothetical protein
MELSRGVDPALPGCPMGRAGPAVTVLRAAAARSMKLTFRAPISNGAREYLSVISKDAAYCTRFSKVSQ